MPTTFPGGRNYAGSILQSRLRVEVLHLIDLRATFNAKKYLQQGMLAQILQGHLELVSSLLLQLMRGSVGWGDDEMRLKFALVMEQAGKMSHGLLSLSSEWRKFKASVPAAGEARIARMTATKTGNGNAPTNAKEVDKDALSLSNYSSIAKFWTGLVRCSEVTDYPPTRSYQVSGDFAVVLYGQLAVINPPSRYLAWSEKMIVMYRVR